MSVLQFMEGLSDRQAAAAVRGRIDWKFLLGLGLTDPGFDHSVLSEFRDRLVADRGRGVCWSRPWSGCTYTVKDDKSC
ncbi:transposase [Streptomyces sp. SAI-149]|nr:transposase [Streptomyces sp. SAI-119]MDH6495132.1 transposase [Streptomyces sp. SAI-149]